MKLHLDFETVSAQDLSRVGVYRYAEDPSTAIVLVGYAIDDEPVKVWQPGTTAIPQELLAALMAPDTTIHAWNVQFERLLWTEFARQRGYPIPPLSAWHCTMAKAAMLGWPRSLDRCATALGLGGKNSAQVKLMKQLSKRAADTTELFEHTKYDALVDYCRKDVELERAIDRMLPNPITPEERAIWLLDQAINDYGIAVDLTLVDLIRDRSNELIADLNAKIQQLTAGAVVSVSAGAALKRWLTKRQIRIDSVDQVALTRLLQHDSLPNDVRAVIRLRLEGNKLSLAKAARIREMTSRDGRLRGTLLYYGARTGRWAGRGPQLQNLPRNVTFVEGIHDVLRSGLNAIAYHWPDKSIADILTGLLRPCLVASSGTELIGADFSEIEARVLARLAGAAKLLDAFRAGRSPYLDMGRLIFGFSPEKGTLDYLVAKSAVLGCGYGMGAERFQNNIERMSGSIIPFALAEQAVTAYSKAYPEIPRFRKELLLAAEKALARGTAVRFAGLLIDTKGEYLAIQLPSGRHIWYPRASKEDTGIRYWDYVIEDYVELHPGKITENVVSAIARDLLANAMLRLNEAGFQVVLSVHDEVVAETMAGWFTTADLLAVMLRPPDWARDWPVAAKAWKGARYTK